MKFLSPLIVVTDLEKSKLFYKEVLDLDVVCDFGENVTLAGGISLQSKNSWKNIIEKEELDITFGGNNYELYFEEDNFDKFIIKLYSLPYINYIHPVIYHPWGQRAVRFYDPDNHIIEVGENMILVIKGFMSRGMSIEETAIAMDVSIDYLRIYLKYNYR